ncbi:bacteriochlorophyll 4-vinyl reductase [Meridianimarinicoccus aquatilis]|uniref:Bacteriochlorophyll 4-vinyl reductase n=1 Tax=Meridianimarinicoccus aquatilis TaxID=2552766 RepID=A0A4R6B2P7_9RHOB|nr:bacteriochlorophyll 4-vinyl reductase [Fluviibacterium aquatile]TDL90522.1 bacteriochlorophyll 4-vinyl reductase [Fluviibacterium aquatile]
MSRDGNASQGLIGPNAILQFLPVLDRFCGPVRRAQILAAAGIFDIPDGLSMIPETDAARLHRQIRKEEPALAPTLAAKAGFETANYILANRIPDLAQTVLKVLPRKPAARILSGAIEKHAWTFAGSGSFKVQSAWSFTITNNPIVRGEVSGVPLCAWHTAVFERLYRVLVSPDCRCEETLCAAQGSGNTCHFKMSFGDA